MIDYMIMEAVALKVHHQDQQQQKNDERKQWRKDTSNLEKFR